MQKAVIFGAGVLGKMIYSEIRETSDVLFFIDNQPQHYSRNPSLPEILHPQVLQERSFDIIYIGSADGKDNMYHQLTRVVGVPPQKIDFSFTEKSLELTYTHCVLPRIRFLEQLAEYAHTHCIDGCVAELGVNNGDFAKEINRVFSDRRLYLFDSFDGFSEDDLKTEEVKNERFLQLKEWATRANLSFTSNSPKKAWDKLPFPEKCTMKVGYFPESFDLKHESFAFVNLDMDLYHPVKSGLEIFYPRMSHGGVILVHDYFAASTYGVKRAVDEFVMMNKIAATPIGDFISVAIVKT